MIESKDKKPLLIIDGYGFIFRAYHVQPPLTSPNGDPVGAIYGFTSMLLKLLADFKPEYAVVTLDHKGKNFRHDLYEQYKANRPPAPEDLKLQLPMVQKAAENLNFKCISREGYEADDIIATLATKCSQNNHPAIIVSADKDLMQLIDGNVRMYDPSKYKFIEHEDIVKKFGVGADKVRQVQALMGDKSDNIPGIAGIGPKTAADLINKYGDLKGIFEAINQLTPRQQQMFTEHKQDVLLSWELVGLDCEVDIDCAIENYKWQAPKAEDISKFINENGFKSLNRRIENLFQVKIAEDFNITTQDPVRHIEVKNEGDLSELLIWVKKTGRLSIADKDEKARIILLSDCKNIYEIDFETHMKNAHIASDLFAYASGEVESCNVMKFVQEILSAILSDNSVKKICYDAKALQKKYNLEIVAYEDLMIMEYVLNAGKKLRQVVDIVGNNLSTSEAILGYSDCYDRLYAELVANRALHLYNEIDLPILPILKAMEDAGVALDVDCLKQISLIVDSRINILEQEIYQQAGKKFNISSPKQLGGVLFEDMKLPFGKKSSKAESYVTNVDILEKLRLEGHRIADLLLDYRHLSKLKSTYIDALPKQINLKTNRIHTTFLQCSTSTSRLSSINPNIQNIPIRTEEGNKIRAAFVARKGYKLISADYSQIELRILSYVADIKSLKDAFNQGKDIHAQTASQIFKIPLDQVTSEIRRKAKAINFGIIYGISGFGLAKQLDVSNYQANEYIKLYFQEYPGIEKYMNDTIQFAKNNGFVENMLGRKCHLPFIDDKSHALRAFAQRAAINAPMQSLASEIVKIAMINLNDFFIKSHLKTKMILQIHDELIFEAPETEVELLMPEIKAIMERQLPGNLSDLKLKVDINFGDNWQQIH